MSIDKLHDLKFAVSVAEKSFQHQGDKAVFYHLFVKLMSVGEREQAIEVLSSHFHAIAFDKVNLPELNIFRSLRFSKMMI